MNGVSRLFYGFILLLSLASCRQRCPDDNLPPPSSQPSTLLGPAIVYESAGNASVWWHAGAKTTNHTVRYGRVPSALSQSARYQGSASTSPQVALHDLAPGALYYYRVASDGLESELLTFRQVPQNTPIKFAVWGDNQKGCDVFRKDIVPLLKRLQPDFLLSLGDQVDHGKELRDWRDHLYEPARELLQHTPWLAVRGNHDGHSQIGLRFLPMPRSSPGWYLVRIGTMTIVVLDTENDYSPSSPQFAWLSKTLLDEAWTRASLRIVAFHHPPYVNYWQEKGHNGEKGVRAHLLPLLGKARAHVIFNGHAHLYERGSIQTADGWQMLLITSGGGGGPLDSVKVAEWPHIRTSQIKHHVLSCLWDGKSLNIKAVEASGVVIDQVSVRGGT